MMEFHHHRSIRAESFSGSVDRFLDDALHGKVRIDQRDVRGDGKDVFAGILIEKAWRLVDRPYYNVYPIVESLCRKTKLDLSWGKVSFPFSPLLFRFPVGHEPHGIACALVYTVPAPDVPGWDFGELPAFNKCWSTQGSASAVVPCAKVRTDELLKEARTACGYLMARNLIALIQFITPAGRDGFLWSVRADSWEETVEQTLNDPNTNGADKCAGFDHQAASVFLARLSVLAALVGQGDDLITPEILARDESKYGPADLSEKHWIEERARRVNGRGFSFGKRLQRESELSPHWRNPHMALFWTGKNRSVPVLKLRSGCVVTSTALSEIPTGFLSKELAQSIEPAETTFVYRVPAPKRMRFFVMQRDRFTCQLCGMTQADGVKLEVDHKVPVAKGGKTRPENLWTLCHPCNNGKSDSDLNISGEPAA